MALERVATGDPLKGLRSRMRQRDARKSGMTSKTAMRQNSKASK